MYVACNLGIIRELKGMSQAELGEKTGVSQQMIFQLERGLRMPSVSLLIDICQALGCTPNDILGFESEKEV